MNQNELSIEQCNEVKTIVNNIATIRKGKQMIHNDLVVLAASDPYLQNGEWVVDYYDYEKDFNPDVIHQACLLKEFKGREN